MRLEQVRKSTQCNEDKFKLLMYIYYSVEQLKFCFLTHISSSFFRIIFHLPLFT